MKKEVSKGICSRKEDLGSLEEDILVRFRQENKSAVDQIFAIEDWLKNMEEQKNMYSGKKRRIIEEMIKTNKEAQNQFLDEIILKINNLAGKNIFLNEQEILILEEMKTSKASFLNWERRKSEVEVAKKCDEMTSFVTKYLGLHSQLLDIFNRRILEKAAEERKKIEQIKQKKIITENEDRKNLLELRKKLERIPSGEKDYFDPEEELQKIRRDIFAENFLSRDEKKERLRLYKDKLARQKMVIADINQKLEDYLLKEKNFDEKEFLSIFEEEAKRHKLAPFQVERYKLAFEKIKERMKIIDYYSKSFEGMSEEEKFERIFGFKSEGSVRVENSRICFSVLCESSEDYANVYSAGVQGEVREYLREKADCSAGVANMCTALPELQGAVIAVRNIERGNIISSIFDHEEKHILNKLIYPAATADTRGLLKRHRGVYLENISAWEKLRSFFEFRADYIRERARDELLAYIRDGTRTLDILFILGEKEEKG